MKNKVYDTLRPFCSNILVDIPNHDEEEGEAEEADELAMIFNSFGGPSGKRGGEGLCFNGLECFFLYSNGMHVSYRYILYVLCFGCSILSNPRSHLANRHWSFTTASFIFTCDLFLYRCNPFNIVVILRVNSSRCSFFHNEEVIN